MGNYVVNIDTYAFEGSGLTTITIPSSVVTIGNYAFQSCSSLGSVSFSSESTLGSIGDSAFHHCPLNRGLGWLRIPSSVNTIGSKSFSDTKMNNLTFGNNSQLWEIGSSAFAGSSIAGDIKFPSLLIVIGESAFADCASLEQAYFPCDSTASIGQGCFSGSSVSNIELPDQASCNDCGSSVSVKDCGQQAGTNTVAPTQGPTSKTDVNNLLRNHFGENGDPLIAAAYVCVALLLFGGIYALMRKRTKRNLSFRCVCEGAKEPLWIDFDDVLRNPLAHSYVNMHDDLEEFQKQLLKCEPDEEDNEKSLSILHIIGHRLPSGDEVEVEQDEEDGHVGGSVHGIEDTDIANPMQTENPMLLSTPITDGSPPPATAMTAMALHGKKPDSMNPLLLSRGSTSKSKKDKLSRSSMKPKKEPKEDTGVVIVEGDAGGIEMGEVTQTKAEGTGVGEIAAIEAEGTELPSPVVAILRSPPPPPAPSALLKRAPPPPPMALGARPKARAPPTPPALRAPPKRDPEKEKDIGNAPKHRSNG